MTLTGELVSPSQDHVPAPAPAAPADLAVSERLRAALALPDAPLAMPIQELSPAPMRLFGRTNRQRPAIRP